MKRYRALGAAVALVCAAASAQADDYDRAREALDRADYPVAIDALADLAEAGDTLAATELGNLLQTRVADGSRHIMASVAWFSLAAYNGSVHAMLENGLLFQYRAPELGYDTRNMAAGYFRAIDWYQQAIDAGSPLAQAYLGRLYRLGLHSSMNDAITRDEEDALSAELLAIAAEAGVPVAQGTLAFQSSRNDPAAAMALARQAAESADPTALGVLLEAAHPREGRVSPMTPVEAYAWGLAARVAMDYQGSARPTMLFALGIRSGEEFDATVADLAAPLSDVQRAEAQAMADDITAGWMSYMPGGPRPGHDADGTYASVRAALEAADYATAIDGLADMAEAGDNLAATMLAELLLSRATLDDNNGLAAAAWLEMAADRGSVHAMLQLGDLNQNHPFLFDADVSDLYARSPQARDWYQRAADAGAPLGLAHLGMLHRLGVLSRMDETMEFEQEAEMARQFLSEAADAGIPFAISTLGVMARRDSKEEMQALMHQAAELGDPLAIGHFVGDVVRDGSIMDFNDLREGLVWAVAAEFVIVNLGDARSPAFIILGIEKASEYGPILAEISALVTPEERMAAYARAEELTAGWMSYMPNGQRPGFENDAATQGEAPAEEQSSGGLFGRD